MTDPRNNFDDDLRTLLSTRAEAAPQADLAERALDQARSIRRRRRIGAGVAVTAVIAVAAPVGASVLSGEATDSSPAPATQPTAPTTQPEQITLELSLAGLDRGDDPSVPYLDEGQWHSDDEGAFTQLAWPNGHTLIDVAEFDEGVAAWTADSEGRVHMSTPGIDPGIDLTPPASSPAVDDSTGAVAFALGDVLYYGSSLSEDTPSVTLDGISDITLLDAHDGVVVFSGVLEGQPIVGRVDVTATPPTYEPVFTGVEATAFSLAANLMGQLGQDTVPDDPNESRCAVLTDLDDVNEGGWGSCDWRPESFSPDGSRVFALDTRTEGFGPRRAAVLDAETGEVLLDLTAEGTFGFWPSWESNDSVLLTMVEDDAAIIRCIVGVGCELATDPKPAAPDSLLYPYHLTAN